MTKRTQTVEVQTETTFTNTKILENENRDSMSSFFFFFGAERKITSEKQEWNVKSGRRQLDLTTV